jgi:hypothetical protein
MLGARRLGLVGFVCSCLVGCVLPDYHGAGAGGAGAGGGGATSTGGSAPDCDPIDHLGAGGCGSLGTNQNCAGCGHDCLGGTCTAMVCTDGKVGTDSARFIAMDDAYVYSAGEATPTITRVLRTALDLVVPDPLGSLTDVAYGTLRVHGGYVYAGYNGGIDRVAIDGSDSATVVKFVETYVRPNAILVEDDFVYYITDYVDPGFGRVPISAALPATATLISGTRATQLAADETAFYTTLAGEQGMANGLVDRYTRAQIEAGTTMTPETILDGQELPNHLVVLGDYLYFDSAGTLYRVLKTASVQTAVRETVHSFGPQVAALTDDGCDLFVTTGTNANDGMLYRIAPAPGATPEPMGTPGFNGNGGGLVADRTHVFFGGLGGLQRIVR